MYKYLEEGINGLLDSAGELLTYGYANASLYIAIQSGAKAKSVGHLSIRGQCFIIKIPKTMFPTTIHMYICTKIQSSSTCLRVRMAFLYLIPFSGAMITP